MDKLPTSFERHIEAIQDKGRYSAVYELTGRVDLQRLGRHFNMVVRRSHPEAVYHFMWFRTGDSITVAYTGNMFLLDAVEDYMQRIVNTGATGQATELVSGRDRALFTGVLQQRLSLFTPQPLKRSYGGSQHGK